MITIDKLKKNFGEKIAVDIEHYGREISQLRHRDGHRRRRVRTM